MKLTKSILTFLTVLSSMQLGAVAPDAVERDYQARKQAVGDDSYFVMADTLSDPVERRYMRFLYAYMPLPDIIDYPAQFYLDNVRQSIKTAKEMPWGKLVPEREFMHFVLPVRVNNEHLDSARTVFYDELKGRLAGLSMSDAVLEVNHWLHEKATYQPSD
ncbi:MAG: transglutaminase domain-containing protein, partial [Muribaculaceae bacterium]|nr:transglutaminase domain-containing protein [Muribaculaceae bacterium]